VNKQHELFRRKSSDTIRFGPGLDPLWSVAAVQSSISAVCARTACLENRPQDSLKFVEHGASARYTAARYQMYVEVDPMASRLSDTD